MQHTKTFFYLIAFLTLTNLSAWGQMQAPDANFEERVLVKQALFDLPDVHFQAIETPANYGAAYELRIKQPIDHQNPSKGYFLQRVFLSHKGFDRPTVIVTEGYARAANRMYELSELLQANQVIVEHRYFGASIPSFVGTKATATAATTREDTMDWQYLTLEQATADLHKINQLLKQMYSEKWVSTGISKGGQTTIFYRYFYPDDVAVSVPYVAPLNTSFADERIYQFLDNIGTADCRAKIGGVQKRLLENRGEVLNALKWFAKGKAHTFTYMSLEQAFEYAVLEYPFSFWQWGHSCDAIPSETDDLEVVINYFLAVVGLSLYADELVNYYGPHYYQAATQMGYYGFETKDFEGLITALPNLPHAAFAPQNTPLNYNSDLSNEVFNWLKKEGNEMAYIYGALDTWSATAVPHSKKVDALWFMMPNAHHGTARIANMQAKERKMLVQKLEQWLEMEVE